MSSILCLSGWGQKFNSLEKIFSDPAFKSFQISSLNYLNLSSTNDFFSEAKKFGDVEILVGWSLGGQMLLRSIAQKIFKPKLLILIAPPFQMVKDLRIRAAMSQETFAQFYQNFVSFPTKTLKKFVILSAMNDRNASQIAKDLEVDDSNFEQLKFWLEELARFSCFDVDFANDFPQDLRTLYFQGAGDMIVHPSQAEYFLQRIKNFRLEIFKDCGHAPHLNDLARVRSVICEEILTPND